MAKKRYLEELIRGGLFRFNRLDIDDIDNDRVARDFSVTMLEQEICLFSQGMRNGDDYCRFLHERFVNALQQRQPLPVVRFADGEYAFYNHTLGCNGLYQQAESVAAIKRAMPQHIQALKYLGTRGLFAPLVFPGNAHAPADGIFSLWQKKNDSVGAEFLDFLQAHDINLTPENYVPFYVVYAYLSSPQFAAAVNRKKICILNSDYNEECCRNWFSQFSSHPILTFVHIPAEYVATRWEESKMKTLKAVPRETDLCLVGAGVGALLICADLAQNISVPAIDAGHVLNMMNSRMDKSNGARLYTLRKKA